MADPTTIASCATRAASVCSSHQLAKTAAGPPANPNRGGAPLADGEAVALDLGGLAVGGDVDAGVAGGDPGAVEAVFREAAAHHAGGAGGHVAAEDVVVAAGVAQGNVDAELDADGAVEDGGRRHHAVMDATVARDPRVAHQENPYPETGCPSPGRGARPSAQSDCLSQTMVVVPVTVG